MPNEAKPLYQLNEERFKRRLAYIASDDDCWIWGSTVRKRVRADGTVRKIPVLNIRHANGREIQTYARRYAWEVKYGQIYPPDSHIVNVCGEDLCVKPDPKHNKPAGAGERWHEQQAANRPDIRPQGPRPVPQSDEEFLKGK